MPFYIGTAMRSKGWIMRWMNLHFCLFPIRSWTKICFQSGQSNRFVCFQCAREARTPVSGCRWQWLGLGLSSAVARAWVSTGGGSVPFSLLWVGLWFFFFFIKFRSLGLWISWNTSFNLVLVCEFLMCKFIL